MPQVFIKQFKNILELSRDGTDPLKDEEYNLLIPAMEYVLLVSQHGPAARDPATGEHMPVRSEKKRLYYWDQKRRLVCHKGYFDRIHATFQERRYKILFQDKSPPRPRPRAFEPRWENLRNEEFRPYQRECLEAIAERIALGRGGVIKAVPGFGKSYHLRHLCLLYPRAKIAITAPDIDNCGKTWRHISERLPLVGMVGDRKREKGRRVTIYTCGSLQHCPEDLDLLFVDEAHRYAAPQASTHLGRITMNAVSLALTATPRGRFDRADAKIEPLFGPVIFEVGWDEARAANLVVPITVHWHDVNLPKNPCGGMYGVPKKRWGLWRNENRNRIVAKAVRAYPAEDQVLVLAQAVEHVLHLRKHLPEFEVVYSLSDEERIAELESLRSLEGVEFEAMTRERRENMRLAFERGTLKKVICNDVWSTGVSFNQLAVMARADARSNEIADEQFPSRVSRTCAETGKEEGIVLDFLDQFDGGLHRAAQSRRHNYREKGWGEVMPSDARALRQRMLF